MRIIRAAGTWLPLFIVLFATVAAIDQALVGKPTWELLIVYGVAFVSLFFGVTALIQMARFSRRRFPSFLILTFIYQKICLGLVFGAVFALLLNRYVEGTPHIPEVFTYPLLVASVTATAVVNFMLYFGRKRGWLETSVDPLPFRHLGRRLKAKLRRNP